jgi:hypothetical protein
MIGIWLRHVCPTVRVRFVGGGLLGWTPHFVSGVDPVLDDGAGLVPAPPSWPSGDVVSAIAGERTRHGACRRWAMGDEEGGGSGSSRSSADG